MPRTANLLTTWFSDFLALSSNLAIRQIVYREHVEAIYQILSDFFGVDFFEINPLSNLKSQKLHFVQALLMKRNKAHYYKLFEFCMLVEKAKANVAEWQKIDSVKFLSEPLRDVMFELYVGGLFESNGIFFSPNMMRKHQIVEGYCKIENDIFLYECKRKKSIITKELNIKSFVATDLLESLELQPFGFEFIVMFKFKKQPSSISNLHQTLKRFKTSIKNRTSNTEVKFECEFLVIEVKPFSVALEIEVTNNLLSLDGYLIAKDMRQQLENGKEMFNIIAVTSGGHSKNDTISKFMKSLNEAKKQHKEETAPRLFIFENEHLADISAPLLRMDEYYSDQIRTLLKRRKNKDLILIIFKDFMQNPLKFSAEVFGDEKFEKQIEFLKNLEFGIVNSNAIFTKN